jgi:transcriptional regulator with XRE-family HTH domain
VNTQPSKLYFRQRLRNRIYEDVIKAIEEAAATTGVKQKDIAQKLDLRPSQVSRWLSGPANWGVDTVSDLLWSIDAELDFHVRLFRDRKKKNYFHPMLEHFSNASFSSPDTLLKPIGQQQSQSAATGSRILELEAVQ